MACAHEYAAVHCLQGEDVTGLYQVGGLGGFCHGHFDGARTVSGRDAGGYALSSLDGDCESGAVDRTVASGHWGELQIFAALAREREANQATAKAGHEVDGFGGDVVRRQHQVTFVFAVFFVHQDDDAASFHVGHDVFDGRYRNRRNNRR